MSAENFPSSLLRLIRSSVPTFAAAEVLLFLCRHPAQRWKPDEMSAGMRPTVIAPAAVQEYLALFAANGLLRETEEGFEYAPASPELGSAVNELQRAYNERPVTLIRTIYSIADLKIQSFADSFRLKPKDPED